MQKASYTQYTFYPLLDWSTLYRTKNILSILIFIMMHLINAYYKRSLEESKHGIILAKARK
jgi:hypothetical protein